MNTNTTPILTSLKSPEEAEKEMREVTKKELEKLAKIMEERMKNNHFKTDNKEFLIEDDSTDEEEVIEDEIESSDSSDTKNIIAAISGIRNRKEKKNKREAKSLTSSLVNNAVMVEKLRNEIIQLESRIRYKDLDMVNLTVEKDKLQETVEKYKIFREIFNRIQIKELILSDISREFNENKKLISKDNRRKLLSNYATSNKKLDDLIANYDYKSSLDKLNIPLFSKMILDKNEKLNKEYEDIKTLSSEIIQQMDLNDETELFILKVFFTLLMICGIVLLKVFYF